MRFASWGESRAAIGFIPVQHERYDFAMVTNRSERPGVRAFVAALRNPATREALTRLGMTP